MTLTVTTGRLVNFKLENYLFFGNFYENNFRVLAMMRWFATEEIFWMHWNRRQTTFQEVTFCNNFLCDLNSYTVTKNRLYVYQRLYIIISLKGLGTEFLKFLKKKNGPTICW